MALMTQGTKCIYNMKNNKKLETQPLRTYKITKLQNKECFEVFMVVIFQTAVFWVVTPRNLLDR
jgi:CMP-N-acetylneuraminic acid synthetase